MAKDEKITSLAGNRRRLRTDSKAVAMMVFIAAAMLIMAGCQRKPVLAHAQFFHLPADGWIQSAPLTFSPEYDDSARTYNLMLAVRHRNSYRYRNLSLVVDVIASDSVVTRKTVNLPLADEYGNWRGAGFGALYQDTVGIAGVIDPGDARSVVVWQAMAGCDTLRGLADVGLITQPL